MSSRTSASVIRQVGLVLLASLLLALLGSAGIQWGWAREQLQVQGQQRNDDAAAMLALTLSQLSADREAIDRLLSAQFDTGGYRHIRFEPADGSAPFLRDKEAAPGTAPTWFVQQTGVEPQPGTAQAFAGGRAVGTLQVARTLTLAHDALWRSARRAAAALGTLGLAIGLLGALAVQRIRRPLAAAVGQARALVAGRLVTLPEPQVQELHALTQAMNAMVARLKVTFEAQALQVEQWRRQAHCDALTGLANRSHFLGQFEASLLREDGPDRYGLVLLRLRDLAGVNRTLGRVATDRILSAIAQALQPYSERVPGCFPGRLNGADFALCLPVGGVALETAQALAAALRALLPELGPGVGVAFGALELRRETALADALAAADEALALAETRGTFKVALGGESDDERGVRGEDTWRLGITEALADGRAGLVGFVLIDACGGLVHLECPLRLQLHAGGAFEVAARWLPLAVRARMTAEIDLRAVALALAAIARDGQPRCVNLAPASLAESGFASRLRALVFGAPRMTRKLWLEVDEAAAVDRFALLQELARQLRACGVRLGLEHAGARLGRIDRLLDLGLDFIKLDTATTRGVGSDPLRLNFVRGSVELLHGLQLQVYAEGVADDGDARALWACGIDGITGPWATAQHAGADA